LFKKPVSWICISLILGCGMSARARMHSARVAYELVLLYEIEACFHYDVVLVAEDRGDLVRDPFLHQVNVDLLNVDFLIELWWELSRFEALLINAERHDEARLGCSKVRGVLGGVESVEVKVQVEVGGRELSEQLAARRQDEPGYVRLDPSTCQTAQ
jgi:hypothetical protein